MSFIKSILFGSPGLYKVGGICIQYRDKENSWWCHPPSLNGAGYISSLANKCLNSNALRWATQGYCHVLVHEMGHALACKLLTGRNSIITIKTDTCTAQVHHMPALDDDDTAHWKLSVIDVSGPMADMAFSTLKIVVANALKSTVSQPVALLVAGGAMAWMSGELFYAYISTTQKNGGDFCRIANRGTPHLIAATTLLISQAALGVFAMTKLMA